MSDMTNPAAGSRAEYGKRPSQSPSLLRCGDDRIGKVYEYLDSFHARLTALESARPNLTEIVRVLGLAILCLPGVPDPIRAKINEAQAMGRINPKPEPREEWPKYRCIESGDWSGAVAVIHENGGVDCWNPKGKRYAYGTASIDTLRDETLNEKVGWTTCSREKAIALCPDIAKTRPLPPAKAESREGKVHQPNTPDVAYECGSGIDPCVLHGGQPTPQGDEAAELKVAESWLNSKHNGFSPNGYSAVTREMAAYAAHRTRELTIEFVEMSNRRIVTMERAEQAESALSAANRRAGELEKELATLRADSGITEDPRKGRIFYQDLVYKVCNVIDEGLGRCVGNGTATSDAAVATGARELLNILYDTRDIVMALKSASASKDAEIGRLRAEIAMADEALGSLRITIKTGIPQMIQAAMDHTSSIRTKPTEEPHP